MKRLLSLGLLAFFLNSCDDGDIVYQELNFDSKPVEKCSTKNLFLKKNGKDMLIFKIDTLQLSANNLPLAQPKTFDIGTNVELIYRIYDDVAISASICESLPPAKPVVTSEMKASPGGTAIVTRDLRTLAPSTETDPITIVYFYNFEFRNISFKDGDNDINNSKIAFGEYQYTQNQLTFKFKDNFNPIPCTTGDDLRLVVHSDTDAMVLSLPQNSIALTEGTQTIDLDQTHFLLYKSYQIRGGVVTSEMACSNETVFGNTKQLENWKAVEGTVKIVTNKVIQAENNPEAKTEYSHKISLEKVKFTKEGRTFTKAILPFGIYTSKL